MAAGVAFAVWRAKYRTPKAADGGPAFSRTSATDDGDNVELMHETFAATPTPHDPSEDTLVEA